jgi:hypothetical protein
VVNKLLSTMPAEAVLGIPQRLADCKILFGSAY